MKYCPTCETRYDEDILRFCMKDGTPLLEEAEPNFVEMPSESLDVVEVDPDDPSEHTVIRRNIPVPPLPSPGIEQPPAPPPTVDDDFSDVRPNSGGQRIVVPTIEEQQRERARIAAQYRSQQPRGSNTALVVLVTIFGTIIVVGIGGILLFFLVSNGSDSNTNANVNVNANQDVNANTNLGTNSIFDFNTNTNSSNSNVNANVSTPTPTPTMTPTPRPTESPSPTPENDESPTPLPSRTPIPTPTPVIIRPGPSPTPLRTPAPTPRTIITPTVRTTP
ncbi:MAG: hypothetical protein PSX80_15185 [bacterium]|nr:hypothetical protein [bacterium]